MKLYFSPGACSQASHIALKESGLDYELDQVTLATQQTASGKDFSKINPYGYVPALELDSGEVLTEGPAILQYIADLAPEKALAPAPGSMDRYRLQAWLTFISTELHKNFSPFFRPDTPDAYKPVLIAKLQKRFAQVDAHLQQHRYLLADKYSIADMYLYVVSNWNAYVGLDLSPYQALEEYRQRIADRSAVQAVQAAEAAKH